MRAPIASESDAFRLTLASVLIIAASLAIGALATPAVGLAVLGVAFLIAAGTYLVVGRRDRPAVLRAAAHEPHPHGARPGTRHVLVIANEALAGDELREHFADGERVEVDIVAPVLTTYLHSGVSDVDRELAAAQVRLQRSLAWAQEHGITARGTIGDPSPTTAIEDALRDFGADEVVVVTHPRNRETRQERGELERLRRELDVPVTQVTVDRS